MERHSTKGSALIYSHIDKHYTNINVYSYEKCAIIMTNSSNNGLNIRYANVSVSDTEHLMSHGHRVSANLFSLSLSQIYMFI